MHPVAVLELVVGFALILFGLMVFCGETGLIRSFKFVRVKDRRSYCRFLGKTIALTAVPLFAGACISLLVPFYWGSLLALAGIIVVLILAAKMSRSHYE